LTTSLIVILVSSLLYLPRVGLVRPGWINESMKLQETDPNYFGTVNYDHQLVYTIHHDLFDIPDDENRTMAPSW
jgi:hypothetical protein